MKIIRVLSLLGIVICSGVILFSAPRMITGIPTLADCFMMAADIAFMYVYTYTPEWCRA